MPPADETISTPTIACPKCGYNLHGIPEDRCPECGFGYDHESIRTFSAIQVAKSDAANRRVIVLSAWSGVFAMPSFAAAITSSFLPQMALLIVSLMLAVRCMYVYGEPRAPAVWRRIGTYVLLGVGAIGLTSVLTIVHDIALLIAVVVTIHAWITFVGSRRSWCHMLEILDAEQLRAALRHERMAIGSLAAASLFMAGLLFVMYW